MPRLKEAVRHARERNMENPPEPNEDDNHMYMEIVASIMNMLGKDEIFIPEKHFQNSQYQIWRKFENADARGLRVKLVKT